jgi:predicted amidohydrolase
MKVAAVQLPFGHADSERALTLIAQHSLNAQREGAELLCFPECFLQGYDVRAEHIAATALDLGSPAFALLLYRLKDVAPVIVFGLFEQDAGAFYNTAVVISRGALVTRYRKRHLIGNELEVFEPGTECPVFAVGGMNVGINICYDTQFAEAADLAVSNGAELLVCPCNNMLRPEAAEHWKLRHNEMRCQRAREARLWILSSDVMGEHDGRISYGPTALIDPGGEVVVQAPLMKTAMIVVDVHRRAARQLTDKPSRCQALPHLEHLRRLLYSARICATTWSTVIAVVSSFSTSLGRSTEKASTRIVGGKSVLYPVFERARSRCSSAWALGTSAMMVGLRSSSHAITCSSPSPTMMS